MPTARSGHSPKLPPLLSVSLIRRSTKGRVGALRRIRSGSPSHTDRQPPRASLPANAAPRRRSRPSPRRRPPTPARPRAARRPPLLVRRPPPARVELRRPHAPASIRRLRSSVASHGKEPLPISASATPLCQRGPSTASLGAQGCSVVFDLWAPSARSRKARALPNPSPPPPNPIYLSLL